ncbi:SGNH/GDSL hydrolase family protein [Streptomyces sp. SM13]|uniref:SGNH/GDSL hydrolase family protein n=1 Tax=Streptomyces sp. SM13 TaxID=1983803 RepID=UPI000CD4A6FD|nr:SGNH/GDSL hydrolase family protein [Streptomyces sp. SM13]
MFAGFTATALLAGLVQVAAVAEAAGPTPADTRQEGSTGATANATEVPPAQRADLLGKDWKDSSDLAWSTSSDAEGFHILIADKSDGYAWKTAASLSEPGFEADAWIGNACVTASGKRAVAVYAPRTFTNKPELMTRGAFTAVIDLVTGEVKKLAVQSSLAYFSPGCGRGEEAVVSQFTDDSSPERTTRLVTVDARAAKAADPLTVDGQVTSAVPYRGGIAAADGYRVVSIDRRGSRTELAATSGVPFQLRVDRADGLVFLDNVGKDRSRVKRVVDGKVSTLAAGDLTKVDVTASADGTVFITGEAETTRSLPDVVRNPGVAKEATASTRGQALVTSHWQDADEPAQGQSALDARPVEADIHSLATGRTARLGTKPGAVPVSAAHLGTGKTVSPALKSGSAGGGKSRYGAAAASPTDPVEDERACSLPRGSLTKQALQPTPRQVEWAVNQAVIDGLYMWVNRPANWNGTGMSPYTPQTRFPLRVLAGDPNGYTDREDEWHIPSQILLGITAQESNMWQATRTVVPGLTGNPLIGNYYGIKYASDGTQNDPWAINWSKADCGYGITQVTDGMRKSETSLTADQKEAAALDYTANIAYGADILASKWNDTRKDGLTVNDGKPKHIENWFFALWAYNAGYYPKAAAGSNGGKWGVGWTNNPANPLWKENRTPFLENASGADDYSHAANPQHWPYQEKVIGWAARPISAMFKPGDMQAGYRPAWWNSNQYRTSAKPPIALFCDESNDCDNSKINEGSSNQTGNGPCTLPGDPNESDPLYLKCWWHKSVEWKSCAAAQCGYAIHRFNNSDYPEQPNENSSYPPRCDAGLPAGTLVVDDVPNGVRPAGQTGHTCGAVSSDGTFAFSFADWNGTYPGKIDLHQIGAGYGDHFWFTHTRPASTSDGARLKTTGTWTLGSTLDQWVRIMVHVPDHGAHTQQARYEIDTGNGVFSRHRYIGQEHGSNAWVTLGVYKVSGKPRVRLTSQTDDGTGDEDVAWDAVAFQPLGAKPQQIVAVLGDSYSSGEGAEAYSPESNKDYDTERWNGCRRSKNSWARKATLPGYSSTVGQLTDSYSAALDLQNISCSGARAWQVTAGDPVDDNGNPRWDMDGKFREKSQIDSGVLSDDTTLVALTIGGNDAGFPQVMTECATTGCPPEDDVKSDIDDAMSEVEEILRQIHGSAKNAKIVLLGYPRLFNASAITCVSGVGGVGMSRINALADYMTARHTQLVADLEAAKLPVSFESPDSDFEGKRACDSTEGINKIVKAPQGDGDFDCWNAQNWCVSRESFHPNSTGTSAYAAAFRRAVSNL